MKAPAPRTLPCPPIAVGADLPRYPHALFPRRAPTGAPDGVELRPGQPGPRPPGPAQSGALAPCPAVLRLRDATDPRRVPEVTARAVGLSRPGRGPARGLVAPGRSAPVLGARPAPGRRPRWPARHRSGLSAAAHRRLHGLLRHCRPGGPARGRGGSRRRGGHDTAFGVLAAGAAGAPDGAIAALRLAEADRLWVHALPGHHALWRADAPASALLPISTHHWRTV